MSTATGSVRLSFIDRFEDDRPPGSVLGSPGTDGTPRRGVDIEALMAVDHGALRLRPLNQPGWGREGIAYGPFPRVAGLTMAARVLNGHNSSQTYYFPEGRRQRLRRVLGDARRLRFRRSLHFENLAVGWFASESPADPFAAGNSFVMHAANRDNGELWASVGHAPQRAALGVQNLDIVYVVALRERGAMYLAMSTPGAVGLGDLPYLRPLALDVDDATGTLYAGVQQRILGEVGYRVDTRVSAVAADVVPEWSSWYGTACAADRMTGEGELAGSAPERGPLWRAGGGYLTRTPAGTAGDGEALSVATCAVGLVNVAVRVGALPTSVAIVFRGGPTARWTARMDRQGTTLSRVADGAEEQVASTTAHRLVPGSPRNLQVTDDGQSIGVHIDGRLAFERWVLDDRDSGNREVGLTMAGDVTVADFEVHPLEVPVPGSLDVGAPWSLAGDREVIDERFDTVADDLDGVATPSGGMRWERTFGDGVIELPAIGAAQVRASRSEPNPDRTFYTIEWPDPGCVDVELEMVPPGTARHQGENCRGGLVFWQDPDNYLVVNIFLDDVYDGASVSTFYHLGGHEDMYDAVWSLVWPVLWGEPCRLRVAFDGHRFLSWHDERPVLVRALTDVYPSTPRLDINRVGILVNREWGDDTGTRFTRFSASRREGS